VEMVDFGKQLQVEAEVEDIMVVEAEEMMDVAQVQTVVVEVEEVLHLFL